MESVKQGHAGSGTQPRRSPMPEVSNVGGKVLSIIRSDRNLSVLSEYLQEKLTSIFILTLIEAFLPT